MTTLPTTCVAIKSDAARPKPKGTTHSGFIDNRDDQLKPANYVKAPPNLSGPRVEHTQDDCPPCVLCMWWAGVTTMPPPGVLIDPEILARKLAIARDPDRLLNG